jgi:hypothetical protein
MKIDAEEYSEAQAVVLNIARLVFPLPLAEMLDAIDRAVSVGPFVDPTLWIKGHRQLDRVKALVSKLRAFQLEVEQQLAAELEETPEAASAITQQLRHGAAPDGPGIVCPDCGVRFREGKDLFSHACQTGEQDDA